MIDRKSIYNHLPYPLKNAAASAWGYYLRWWRYSKDTERLVEEALDRETWSDEKIATWVDNRLGYILNRAAKRVPYYRQYWSQRRLSGDNASIEKIKNWPILSKEEVRRNPYAFLADDLNPKTLYQESTSGTTGTPLRLWCKRSMLIEWYALFEARWRRWYGLNFRDRWGMFGGQLVIPISQTKPPFWVNNAGLYQIYFSLIHLSPKTINLYVEAIEKNELTYLYGYASAIYQLGYHMLQMGKSIDLKAVITDAEPLYGFQQEVISRAFHCPVYDTYSLGEMVSAASVCEQRTRHVWPEAGFIESIDQSGNKTKIGHTGHLLATGLLNDSMILIRYDTLDIISTPEKSLCSCGRNLQVIKELYGRQDDAVFTEDGRRIYLLDIIFEPDFEIEEAQIIQETFSSYKIKIVPSSEWKIENSQKIIRALIQRLGQVNVTIEIVKHIERTWRGKLRVVVSLVSNPNQVIL